MKCKDVQNILFAYIDNDISEEERLSVSEHLKHCNECASLLEETRSTRNILLELRKTPALPEIQATTIQENAIKGKRTGRNRVLLVTAIVLPVLLILAVVLPISFSNGVSGVLAKAYAAIEKVETFRFTGESYSHFFDTDESLLTISEEEAFGGNNTYYLKIYPNGTDYYRAIIVADGHRYSYGDMGRYGITESYFEELTPTKEKTLDYLDLIDDVETMKDEIIDGTECYHYKGTVNTEKWLERQILRTKEHWENSGLDIDIDEVIETLSNSWRNKEIRYELWIGKKDYIVRQVKEYMKFAPTSSYETILVMNYYAFNEAINIEPPLDENGKLLDGWMYLGAAN